METILVRIGKVTYETTDVLSYELWSLDGDPLPKFTSGAHVDVHIDDSLIRQYSICNGSDELDYYKIAVKKEPSSRGGSLAMHEKIRVGDTIKISAPQNNFPLDFSAKKYLLIARGIGVTPLYSMAKHLLAKKIDFELIYFISSSSKIVFHKELLSDVFEGKVELKLGYDNSKMKIFLDEKFSKHTKNDQVYMCGSAAFMDSVTKLSEKHFLKNCIHKEYFSPPETSVSEKSIHKEFIIELAISEKQYAVPKGKSILEVLEENGITVDKSCEQGICGNCVTKVLSGEPEHSDFYLTDVEKESGETICVCVSRSKSEVLILDL